MQSNWDQKPLYDVIAMMKGAREPDKWVIRGNHRDGWVFGAEDPLSGQIALMEEAKSLGALAKTGWRPARTLVYASWDGEEPGLLGSTEWAETHAKELQTKAVVYINTDGNDRGLLSAEASYSLRRLFDEAASMRSTDPETGVSVRDRALADVQVRALAADASPELKAQRQDARRNGGDLPLGDLGSGSDYTPFVQHLGIASINLGFGGEGQSGGVYHSAYDTFEHYLALRRSGLRLQRHPGQDRRPAGPARGRRRSGAVPVRRPRRRRVAEPDRGVEEARSPPSASTQSTVDRLLDQKAFALAADPTMPLRPARPRGRGARHSTSRRWTRRSTRLKASAAAYDEAAAGTVAPDKAAKADSVLQSVGAGADRCGRAARPTLVPAPDLRAGAADRLRRQDLARRARSHRSPTLGGGPGLHHQDGHRPDAASAKIDDATAVLK